MQSGQLAEEVIPTVPAPVLAQAWRGGSRQASLSRLLRLCDTEPMSEELARNVGPWSTAASTSGLASLTTLLSVW